MSEKSNTEMVGSFNGANVVDDVWYAGICSSRGK